MPSSVMAQLTAYASGSRSMLHFTAPQRGILDELLITIPAQTTLDEREVLVNVIGRGEVPLYALEQMSMGRHGAAYPRRHVGRAEVLRREDSTVLLFNDIDLRPSNGVDLVITMQASSCPTDLLASATATWRMSTSPLPAHHRGPLYVEHDPSVVHSVTATLGPVPSANTLPALSPVDARSLGIQGDGVTDDTPALNAAIAELAAQGGGTIEFREGTFCLRSVHLQSHVHLHICMDAILKAIPGMDEPEDTWFADFSHNAGDGLLDSTIYVASDNYLVKQDVGHSFFQNAMFWAVRQTDIRIYGSGRITGNGVLDTGNGVLRQPEGRRADKMFSFKLCSDIEIGGELADSSDLWYNDAADEPIYLDGTPTARMLDVDCGGHFVILATGTDRIRVHDVYAGRASSERARDIFDFMACNDVHVVNIYSRVSGDDIVKLGSDCSLGFTRKSKRTYVRNIIGDTNCNLFQIGSETADDIEEVYVDNIYVLATNKAGFSISSNDGGTIRGVWLNSGRTGSLHSRSKMLRTRTPFFVSISNRGRVLGSSVGEFRFDENGRERHELLVLNNSIGRVEDVHFRTVDCTEVYAGSSYYNHRRWQPFDGQQPESTPIFSGYSLPASVDIHLPDGRATGYIQELTLQDISIVVKGGHPDADALCRPPEMGIGKFNIRDLEVQPSYGLWFRHIDGLTIQDVHIHAESRDGRPSVITDDVQNIHQLHYDIH